MNQDQITVQTTIDAPISLVWEYWNKPEHIVNWAFASDDWEARDAENDVRTGGKFKTVMAAKDGSAAFDFTGTYTIVRNQELLEYEMEDGRHVSIHFLQDAGGVEVTEVFDPETENPPEMQQAGWQAILDNFKKYVENDS